MSAKFTVKKDLVEVEIHYMELPNDEIIVIRDPSAIEQEDIKKQIKTARAKFARPGWKNFNTYIKGCIVADSETGAPLMDTISLRDKKLRTLLKGIEDGDGEKILLNSDFFDNILPDFGVALVEAFDDKIDNERLQSLKDGNLLLPEPEVEVSAVPAPDQETKTEEVLTKEPEVDKSKTA